RSIGRRGCSRFARHDPKISFSFGGRGFDRISFNSGVTRPLWRKVGSQNNLYFDEGRLRLRLQILRERLGGVLSESAHERNRRSDLGGRARYRREDRQRRFHGNGRTARKLA